MLLTSCSSWIAYTGEKTCKLIYYVVRITALQFLLFFLICFNPLVCRDEVVMKTAIGVLGDLADTLGSNAGSLIKQSQSCKDFLNECLSSEDNLIKESAEWAKMAISRAISV